MRPRLLTYSLLVLLLTSCLPDDSDDCCYQVLLRYHETVYGEDRFWSDIRQTRHLLYDARGRLVGEYSADANNRQQVLVLNVEDGRYTMVTVANATDRTIFENTEDLSRLTIRQAAPVTRQTDDVQYGNGDELFFNRQSFEAGREPVEIDCELSNIHCHLHVKVQWKGLPTQSGRWTMRLYNVHTAYELATDGLTILDSNFPAYTAELASHQTDPSMFNFELEGEFITFRWTDEDIPQLQIFCDEEPVTGRMELEKAFQEWKWHPDLTQIQDYWLELLIDNAGEVDMRSGGKASVVDWQDGGTIGN